MLNGVQLGPMTEAEVHALPVTPDTPVWSEGFPDWKPASQVEAFAAMFGNRNPQNFYQQNQSYEQPAYQQPASRQQGYMPPYNDMPPMPSTYLVWSILVTLLCCLPFGIVAIIYSAGVESAYNRGDYATALSKSKSAMNWIIASVILGVLSWIANMFIIFGSGFLAALSN